MSLLAAAGLIALLPGCVAKTVTKVAVGQAVSTATAPVRHVYRAIDTTSLVVDKLTTSQSERDQKRGRALRKREERLGKLDRDYQRQSHDCQRGKDKACRERERTYAEIQQLWPTIPG